MTDWTGAAIAHGSEESSPRLPARPHHLTGWWVVIVAYNRYDLVKASANAYLAQSPPPQQILVVDNSDVPDPAALGAPGVQWTLGHAENGRNSGSAGGFAHGMDYAFGHGADYVVLSDQDFMPQPDLLGSLWDTAARYPAAAVSSFTVDPATGDVAPALLATGPDQQSNELCLAPNSHEMAQSLGWRVTPTRFGSLSEIRSYASHVGADVGRVPLAFPQGLAISRQIHDSIGTFRREFFVGWEDYEYCCRLQDGGYPLLLALGAAGDHHLSWHRTVRLGPLCIKPFGNSPDRFYYYLRNSLVMARERARGRLLARWALRLVYYSVIYLAFGPPSVTNRFRSTYRAWRSGLSRIPEGLAPKFTSL